MSFVTIDTSHTVDVTTVRQIKFMNKYFSISIASLSVYLLIFYAAALQMLVNARMAQHWTEIQSKAVKKNEAVALRFRYDINIPRMNASKCRQ